jgi:hypothetical protein
LGEHSFDGLVNLARIAAIRHYQHELISAQPEHFGRYAAGFSDLNQAMADLNQQLISYRVSERIVHVLELVQIEQRNPCGARVGIAREQPAQFFLQREPVGQAGQWVMYGRRPRCKGKESDFVRSVRVQPCIRPLNAAVLAAGPDVIR